MASKIPVLISACIHFVMRVSIFLEQPSQACSPAPQIASWIFFLSTLIVLQDTEIFPQRYKKIPLPCQHLAELVTSLLFIEVSTIIIWCNIEKVAYKFMKCALLESNSNMYYDMCGDSLVGFLLCMGSSYILFNVCEATNTFNLRKSYMLEFGKDIYSKMTCSSAFAKNSESNKLFENNCCCENNPENVYGYGRKRSRSRRGKIC